jgi:hypothetical protein
MNETAVSTTTPTQVRAATSASARPISTATGTTL